MGIIPKKTTERRRRNKTSQPQTKNNGRRNRRSSRRPGTRIASQEGRQTKGREAQGPRSSSHLQGYGHRGHHWSQGWIRFITPGHPQVRHGQLQGGHRCQQGQPSAPVGAQEGRCWRSAEGRSTSRTEGGRILQAWRKAQGREEEACQEACSQEVSRQEGSKEACGEEDPQEGRQTCSQEGPRKEVAEESREGKEVN